MRRILVPRNNLAHANSISHRQAEQIICYSNDVIDSLKNYYRDRGMHQDYNVPLILKVSDSFGNVFHRQDPNFRHEGGGGSHIKLHTNPDHVLFPGDRLTVEVEVDSAFDCDDYVIQWQPSDVSVSSDGFKAAIRIDPQHVSLVFQVVCMVKSKFEWHRMSSGIDDSLSLLYKVLPPH